MNNIVKMVKSSPWLEPHATDFMEFRYSTPVHTVIERIYLNVAGSYGVKWQQISNAKENQKELFAGRIICNLLIINALKLITKMKMYEINLLIGNENQTIIEDYFNYIQGKKD